MSADEKKTARFSVSLTPSEMELVDAWAWDRKIRSLSDAGRQLILAGLAAQASGAKPPATTKKKPKRDDS